VSASGPRRRAIIAALPVAAGLAACTSSPKRKPQPAPLGFFTEHQAAVVEAATARIAPGPKDDPAEAGHPGAREAGVTGYIDTMLGALKDGTLQHDKVFAGGPWSNRHTSGPDLMARFTPLSPVAQIAWRRRLTTWQTQYTKGISQLDKLAGGDFTAASHARQDKILTTQSVGEFRSLLFEHTIEGMYASPEYGGNKNLAGWKEIGFPGDVQPRGYSADEVERSDGHDPVGTGNVGTGNVGTGNTGVVADVLKLLGAL
jgi:Gluconate 2-dehydrogenase subunit 3